jgi:metal-responsive CopG/Arc/MetJ family transcriptional regulator
MRMRMTSYTMPEDLIERLDAEHRRSGAPKSEIVRRALDGYLARREHTITTNPRKKRTNTNGNESTCHRTG